MCTCLSSNNWINSLICVGVKVFHEIGFLWNWKKYGGAKIHNNVINLLYGHNSQRVYNGESTRHTGTGNNLGTTCSVVSGMCWLKLDFMACQHPVRLCDAEED